NGAVYVFTEPAGGWASETEAAKLTASSTGLAPTGTPVAVSGHNVFATAGGVLVFTEPSGGWSGTIHESAKLTASGGALFLFLAASGQTVVASGGVAAYVFTEPAGGWSSETESAKLASAGSTLYSVAISGQTVAASDDGPAFVFAQPGEGWSTEPPTATLAAHGPGGAVDFGAVALSGQVLVAGATEPVGPNRNQDAVYVFTRPPDGWSGETETARLVASDGGSVDNFGSAVAISGDTIVVGSGVAGGASGTALYVFIKPPGGWSGTLSESAKLTVA